MIWNPTICNSCFEGALELSWFFCSYYSLTFCQINYVKTRYNKGKFDRNSSHIVWARFAENVEKRNVGMWPIEYVNYKKEKKHAIVEKPI